MTGIPDELAEKAARATWEYIVSRHRQEGDEEPIAFDDLAGWVKDNSRNRATAALEAIGLPALLERVEAAEGEVAALRTLHTDKIIALDAERKKVAQVKALADKYDEKYGLGDHKRSFIADGLYADLRATLTEGTEGA